MYSFRSLATQLFPLVLTVVLGIILAAAIPHMEIWARDVVAEKPVDVRPPGAR